MRHKKAWLLLMVTILGGCTTMQQSYPDSTPGQVWSAMIIVARDPTYTDWGIVDNNVWVDWTSLEAGSVYERTGAGCPTITPPDDYCYGPALASGAPVSLGPPEALEKSYTQASASVGEVFSYQITVPSVPYGAPLYDVRILDDLSASAADLTFVGIQKVSGSGPWTPANTGTPDALVIEDNTDGTDIAAGEDVSRQE